MEISMRPDYVDPADEDWTRVDDSALYQAMKAGIPEALAEARRRLSSDGT